MKIRQIVFKCLFIFLSIPSWSQADWKSISLDAYKAVDHEIQDSIESLRFRAAHIRDRMNSIIDREHLERSMIVGADDEYIKEGMYKNFSKRPAHFQINMNRDTSIVALEDLHVDLYDADLILVRWLHASQILHKNPDTSNAINWNGKWINTPPGERPNPNSPTDCLHWAEGKYVCGIVSSYGYEAYSNPHVDLKSFGPTFLKNPFDDYPFSPTGKGFPIPQEEIVVSYPINGQIDFDISESIPKIGYILFPMVMGHEFSDLDYHHMKIKARWTGGMGDIKYTEAEVRTMTRSIYFYLPYKLIPEAVYRLEIVAIPEPAIIPINPQLSCWETFRDKVIIPPTPPIPVIPGEVKITELFFRASKYTFMQKLETMKGKVNWRNGEINYVTDEPIDPFEMKGGSNFPGQVFFNIETTNFWEIYDALKAEIVYNYLTVPKIETIDNVPLDILLKAEEDNTMEAPFVRKVNLGNSKGYPAISKNRKNDVPLPGNYIAAAFQDGAIPDSLITDYPIPLITRANFIKDKIMHFRPFKCRLFVGELEQTLYIAQLQQKQLLRRIEERAGFFFALDNRKAIRQGKPFNASIEDYRKLEMDNLPKEVKIIINAKIPDIFKNKFTMEFGKTFPGTSQLNCEWGIKFNPE